MDTYTRIRRNRAIVKGSAVIVIIFAIAGAVFGIRSAAEPTVLQAAATTVAMVLPASFALLSLKRRPSLLLTAVFAAAVIGGAALTGGIGSVTGAIIGALLIAFIENIIILTRIDANWFRFAVGAMIVIAVAINKISRDWAGRVKQTDDDNE